MHIPRSGSGTTRNAPGLPLRRAHPTSRTRPQRPYWSCRLARSACWKVGSSSGVLVEPRAPGERSEGWTQNARSQPQLPWYGTCDRSQCLTPLTNSEAKSEPELQKPLIQRGRPSERRQGDDIARRIHGRRAVQSDYVRAVEDISGFGDEFESHALADREQSCI